MQNQSKDGPVVRAAISFSLALAADSGISKRELAGAQTGLGHISSIVVDRTHGELPVGQQEPGAAFQQVLTFDLTASGNAAPKRTLGTAASPGSGWAMAHDGAADELFTTCNCNNQITVHDRTASSAAPPKRTLQLAGLSVVYSLLVDPGTGTLWAIGNSGVHHGDAGRGSAKRQWNGRAAAPGDRAEHDRPPGPLQLIRGRSPAFLRRC